MTFACSSLHLILNRSHFVDTFAHMDHFAPAVLCYAVWALDCHVRLFSHGRGVDGVLIEEVLISRSSQVPSRGSQHVCLPPGPGAFREPAAHPAQPQPAALSQSPAGKAIGGGLWKIRTMLGGDLDGCPFLRDVSI